MVESRVQKDLCSTLGGPGCLVVESRVRRSCVRHLVSAVVLC